MSIYVETNSIGRVVYSHYNPSNLSSTEKQDGTTFSSVPTKDNDELFVVSGSLSWKPSYYKYEAAGDVSGLRKELKQEAAKNRYQFENEGVTVNNQVFRSNETVRQSLVSTIRYAERYNQNNSTSFEANWKLKDGSFKKMDISQLRNVLDAIGQKRESGFDQEAQIVSNLDAASTITELLNVDLTIS